MEQAYPGGFATTGLKARFFPKNRIGQGLISIAPWLDIVLLVVAFALLDGRLVLQQGVRVELPAAQFEEGTRHGLVAVLLAVEQAGSAEREEIVFFDDERFLVRDADQMAQFKRALRLRAAKRLEKGLVIQADQAVRHGTVVNLMSAALEVGVDRVNVATRPVRD